MSGMIQQGLPPAQSAIQPDTSVQTPDTPQPQINISPSQQPMGKDLQMYVAKGLDVISSPQTRQSIQILLKQGDPVSALANTLMVVIQKLDIAARAKGTEVADYVKMKGLEQLLNDLYDVMLHAGIAKLTEDQKILSASICVQNYMQGEIKAGRINPAKLQMQQRAAMAKLSPEKKKAIQDSIDKIQQTAKAYNGGQGGQ